VSDAINVIYILNVTFAIFMSIYPTYFLSKFYHLSRINPLSIDLIVTLPVTISTIVLGPAHLLNDGLFDKYFNFAILMNNVALVCKFILMYFVLNALNRMHEVENIFNKPVKFTIDKNRLRLLAILFLFLFFISFIGLSSSFGIINWLKNPREGYQYHRTGLGYLYLFSIVTLSTSFTLMTLSTKKSKSIISVSLCYIFMAYFMGSKGYILLLTQYALTVLWFVRYKYLNRLIMIFIPLAFSIMLLNFFITAKVDSVDFNEALSYFDHYQHSAWYFEEYFKGNIPLYNGEILLSSFWGYLPRAFFENKPFVYGITTINELFWPGFAEATNTPAFGGVVDSFVDFGVFGVVFYSLFNVGTIFSTILTYLLYKNVKKENIMQNPKYFYLFMWFFTPALVVSFPFPMNVIIFFVFVSFVSVGHRLKW
jgi:oligosaccharide repeat unit polymerase